MLPVVDETLESKKGYALIMRLCLRRCCAAADSNQTGNGNTTIEYHAWVEVYIEGAMDQLDILLHAKKWSRMDPTFDASDIDYEDDYEDKYYY